jgi:hypothetical protein
MMKYLIIFLLFSPYFVEAQVFDPSQGIATQEQQVCRWYDGSYNVVPLSYHDSSFEQTWSNNVNNFDGVKNVTNNSTENANGCQVTRERIGDFFNVDPDTGTHVDVIQKSVQYNLSAYVDTTMTDACSQGSGGLDYSYAHEGLCFQPFNLSDRDSCNESGNSELTPAFSSDPSSACIEKSDGSLCLANKTDVNGHTVYETSFENTCYTKSAPGKLDGSDVQAPNDSCEQTRTGGLACEGTDSTIPNNGFDGNRYCGSYDVGGGDVAVCFDADSDDDGLPDSNDPDIDNDGLLNVDDSDHDGDGITNENDGDYTSSSGNSSSGSGGETGGDAETSGGDGDTVVNVDLSGVEQRLDNLKEVLLETSGIPSTDDIDTGLESISAELVNDTKAEMAKGIGETCIDGSCGTALDGTETDFIETVFGTFQAAECNNPSWLSYSLDFCSKAPLINEFLYWIVALLTVVGLWEEFHKVTRRKT